MGPLDNRPDNRTGDLKAAENALSAITQEIKHLQQDLILNLAQDFTRLVGEKYRLSEDIDKLRAQQQQLYSAQLDNFLEQQKASQQALAQQLAEYVASQLQDRLNARLDQMSDTLRQSVDELTTQQLNAAAERNQRPRQGIFLAAMDGTLMDSYEQVQQEISTNQSALSEHLNRMNALQQQGEVILESLVNRLIEQLQGEASAVSTNAHLTHEEIERILQGKTQLSLQQGVGVADSPVNAQHSPATVVPPVPEEPIAQPIPTPAKAPAKPPSLVQVGVILALLSSCVLSFFNVCLKVILESKNPATGEVVVRNILGGAFQLAGFVSPGFGNSLLILLLRTIVVILVMPIFASFLYPPVWQDLKRFASSRDRSQWVPVIGSGVFLFVSQVLIYIALGNIPAGIVITIFFVYPIVTVLASWKLFGDKPTGLRYVAMGIIVAGLVLAAVPSFGMKIFGDVWLGVLTALGSGLAFAGYILTAQIGQKKVHPIPFTLIGFLSILVFCCVSLLPNLLFPLSGTWAVKFDPQVWPSLIWSGILLGVLTLGSYLLNNFAIRFAGAALASIIGTSGPALTALFAFLIIGEVIQGVQIGGLVLVTAGVAAMSVERLLAQKKSIPSAGK
jgi:drug/metabolite transporter (DMT)-like permease